MPAPRFDLPRDGNIRKILVIKWSAMGDVFSATILFEDIRRAFPDAEIHLNTMPAWRGLFAHDPRFAKLIAVDVRRRPGRLAATREWLRAVRETRYDLVVDLQTTDRSALLLILLQLSGRRIPYRIGNDKRLPYNIYPQTKLLKPLDKSRAALRAAGINSVTPRPVLHIPPHNEQRAAKLMQRYGLVAGQYALLMPGCQAAGYLKRWGAQRYGQLAQRLHQSDDLKVVLIGGPDELEECERIAEIVGNGVVNLCGQTEIFDVVPLARQARFLVANDTGTAHLASATDRPMVVICGPTDPRKVKPAGDNVVALQADLPCINCYQKHCSHHSCMPAITPDAVYDTLHGHPPANGPLVFFEASAVGSARRT